jgi:molecular chaperone GrpE
MSDKSKVEEQDIKEQSADSSQNEQHGSDENSTSEGVDKSENKSSENQEKNGNNTDALTELQEKYDTLNDKYLRMYSEFENFRRRTAKEKLDLMKSAGSDIVSEILPVIDDFERAIDSNEKSEDHEALKEGFKLIHNKLLHILKNRGLKPMNSLNEPFDTEYHEAITKIPAPEEDKKGKVIDVAEKGYFFNDKIIRYAKVVVGE